MKYLRGYLAAAIFGAITWVLMQYGDRFSTLVDMVYPYVTRTLQNILAQWSSQVSFCLWQLLAVVLGVVLLASLVAVIVLKKSLLQWAGWVLAVFAGIYMLHTALYGLNYYSGALADDIRLEMNGYTLEQLTEAAEYYRNQANALANKVKRDADGNVEYPTFEELAAQADSGFDNLTHKRYLSVFAGSALPVKKLGWSDMYTSMGITGFTFGLTGEAAVNPQAPVYSLPFTMCHEMCHRMCIASERDANFGAFLACSENESLEYQYSGYYMAYRYCVAAMATVRTDAGRAAYNQVVGGANSNLQKDMTAYDSFYNSHKNEKATKVADTTNDVYLKTSGESSGIRSYGQVCDLLVNWYIQKVLDPLMVVEEDPFDPYDKTQVDLSGIVNAGVQANG